MAERNKGMVYCIKCKHGSFMQWFNNPIICQCAVYHEKFVAESKRLCEEYRPRTDTNIEVTHYDHY